MSNEVQLPPLANYVPVAQYSKPLYGDVVMWSGWFSCWTGVVAQYDQKSESVVVIFAGLPFLLFTMDPKNHDANARQLPLSKIRGSRPGTFSVMQYDPSRNVNIWYI